MALIAKVRASAIWGAGAVPVEVESEVIPCHNPNQREFRIIGLGDSAVREANNRVTSALKQAGFAVPERMLVNLAPAELKKEGSCFDLAMAVGVALASGQLNATGLDDTFFLGELALDGRIKRASAAVAHAICAYHGGANRIFVPSENYHEAKLIGDMEVIPVSSLAECAQVIRTGELLEFPELPPVPAGSNRDKSLAEVRGQIAAKRAVVLAAAGAHNLLFVGPPGCGKTMLAERLVSLMPPLSTREALELAQVYSIASEPVDQIIAGNRPFRTPHHGISEAGLAGGGAMVRPGEISLAHYGVLFLDEFPEFNRSALEAIRTPLEAGEVCIARAKGSVRLPARFQLVAAMNPCPCGRLGVPGTRCLCSRSDVRRYLNKLSRPLLDRIDLHVELDALPLSGLLSHEEDARELPSHADVARVRQVQLRERGVPNAVLQMKDLVNERCTRPDAIRLLEKSAKKKHFSARGAVRILRVARTCADLEESEFIETRHVAEAVQYRGVQSLERYAQGV